MLKVKSSLLGSQFPKDEFSDSLVTGIIKLDATFTARHVEKYKNLDEYGGDQNINSISFLYIRFRRLKVV